MFWVLDVPGIALNSLDVSVAPLKKVYTKIIVSISNIKASQRL